MKYNKVIYLRYFPLTAKIYSDFYFERVKSEGLAIEYWDLTALFFNNKFNLENSSDLCKIVRINSYKKFVLRLKEIENISSTLFVIIMTYEPRISKILELLTIHNCIISVFGRNMFPLPSQKSLIKFNLLKLFNFKKILNLFLKIIFTYKIKNRKIKPYDIIFLGGKSGWKGIGRINLKDISNSKLIKVNSDDYDNYLKNKNVESYLDYKYILFLDEYLPLHPDTKVFNISNVKPEDYYPELCKYFDKIEEKFKIPVVIAAHPKALEYKKTNFFNGREVIFGKTVNLSKYASFVISHDTTSINYPICFNKRIHFISSKKILQKIPSVHENTVSFSNYLGSSFQMFDSNEKINLIDKINYNRYKSYKYEFQTWKETETKFSEDIFIDFLKFNTF